MESELKRLAHSEVPESSEGKGALVMKVKQALICQLKTLLFNNTSDIGGGEQVRTLFNKFHDAVFKVGEKIVLIKSFVIDYLRYIWDLPRTTKNYPRQNCWGTVIHRGVLGYPNKDSPPSLPPKSMLGCWCCPQTSWPAVQHRGRDKGHPWKVFWTIFD